MKKGLLTITSLIAFFSFSIYFLWQRLYDIESHEPASATVISTNFATETLQRTSSAEETQPPDRISAKLFGQKARQLESGVKVTDRFADAAVIKTRETVPDKNGHYERKRLIRANFKYPLVLIEERLQKDSQTGAERILKQNAMVADHVMVKVNPGASEAEVNQAVAAYGGRVRKKMYSPDLYLVEFQNVDLDSVSQAIQNFSKAPHSIVYAEPDYIGSVNDTTPNDTNFNLLWGMHNTGQTIGGQTGVVDADIDAPAAWDISIGSSNIIIAVIDTGIDYNHPDLAANMWHNPGEIPGNSIDDDGNGFVDDVYGWDFANDDNDPSDDHYHGTHCAGTIGGVGNNSAGVVGVNWTVRLMALKFLNSGGSGYTSDAVDATHYATMMKVKLTSNSWGGGGYSQALFDAIEEANRSNILFIAASGNASGNTDVSPNYPSGFTNANIIAVAATDNRDKLAYFSNYGLTSVDLGAPGVQIWSCKPGNQYQYLNGTSMACPHVAGTCALVWSINPSVTAVAVKQAVLDGAEPITALNNKCVTGGRLNIYNALQRLEQNVTLTPATGVSFSGFGGGPFIPPSSTYTISNIGTNSFSWTATKTAEWLDLSQTTGSLSPGQSNTVVISINTNNANLLAVGTYTDTLTFSNTISTNVQMRTVSLTVHGEISFVSTSYSVLEGDGTAQISVHRIGNINRAVTVDFATSNGTATAGLDYVPTNGTLTFATGDTVKIFCVGIIDDALSVEPEESVMLTLSNPTGGSTLENPSSATLTIQDNTVTNGLVLKYTFDPDTSPVATDGSPFGNDGQLVNASVVSEPSGNGVLFNGTNAYIRTPSSASLMPNEITLATWVKIEEAPGAWQMLIFKRNTQLNSNEDFLLQIAPDGRASVVLSAGGSQKILYSSSPVTGGWHHVAATFEKPNLKIYVDGELKGSTTHTLSLEHNFEADVLIGCRDHTYSPLSGFFDGLMDDIRIYNRALTAEEIALLAPPMYSLTVENGSGDGSYTNGTQVEIVANASSTGKIFDRWIGATQHVNNVFSPAAMVTMPSSNMILTATYTNLPGWYTLTVHNGTGSGSYSNGTSVIITADAPSAGRFFDRWTGDTQYIDNATAPTATVSMATNDVTLTATYRDPRYTLTVENGSGDGSYATGTIVPVSADTVTGWVFTGWTTEPPAYTNRLASRLSASTTFTMPETNVILTATYNSLTNGLVLKYAFDPDTSPVATDGSPYGNNGQLTNATVITGQFGSCLSMNGSNAYVRTPSNASLMPTSITMSAWVKLANAPGEWETLLFKRGVTEGYLLQISPDGKPSVVLTSGIQTVLPSPSSITGGWHHVAATFEKPNLKIYVDGQLKGSATHNYSLQHNAAAELFIGCRQYQANPLAHFFGGLMDDIRIYNRALSPNEIVSLATPTYLLTVENGSGDGSYTNGTVVPVTADAAAAGLVFSSWTTVPPAYTNRLANKLSASTTFTMPAENVSVTATYKIAFTCTTNNGAIAITGYLGSGGAVVIPDLINGLPVTSIGNSAFANRTSLTSITIPDSVTSIGYKAFNGAGLTNVVVPASVTDYNNDASGFGCAFGYNPLITATVNGCLIGNNMFQGCSLLTNVVLNENSTAIPVGTFLYCSSLTALRIPEPVTSIGYLSFGFSGIQNVYIPDRVTSIGLSAFENCNNLTGAYFAGNAPGFESPIFVNANSATIYRTSEAAGWPTVPTAWAGRPTALWQQSSDADADGLPDSWEVEHFGSLTNANPNTTCANGANTIRQAYIAGLNPNNPQSRFLASVRQSSPQAVLEWSTTSGRVYNVYWTTNLMNGFQLLEPNILWPRNSFTNPIIVPCGYYKIDVRLEE